MKNKGLKYILSLMIFSVLLMAGCGGGGTQRVLTQETPEAAVMRIADSWRVSNNSPAVVVDNSNRFVRQVRAEEITPTPVDGSSTKDSQSSSGSSSNNKTITLYDLANNIYELKVLNVERKDTKASVKCSFLYGSEGYLILLFTLEFDEGKWWLDDVIITNQPLEEGTAIYTVNHIKITPEGKYDIYSTIETGKIGTIVSASPITTFSTYEFMSDYKDNVLSGTITEDGNLTLSLFYKYTEKVKYVVKYIKLDANGKVVEEISEDNWGIIGNTYKAEIKSIKDYVYLKEDSRNKLNGTIQAGVELVLKVYYQYNVEANYTVKLIDVDTQKEIPGYTYSTESVILGKIIKLTPIDIKNYEFVGKDEDLKVTVSKNNIEFKLYYKKLEGYLISGTIVDDGSSVLQGVTVQVFKSDNPNVCITETTTNDNGFYSVTVDSEGTYLVVVTGNGYEPKTIMVTVPEKNTNIRLSCKL